MCGIIGIASNKSVASNIIQSLKKLEYRGYDSAGIATITNGFIDDFSKVLQYNVIYDTDFQEKLLLSLWNYERILDPLQYLGLREQTYISNDRGVFATQDFYCFLQ